VQSQAVTLLSRTKDLRVAIHLVRALLHREGFPGFRDGLAMVRGMLERYWPSVHPQLDPDDHNDPTVRINALAVLSDPAVIAALRSAPILQSRSFGKVSLRDIAVSTGELQPLPGAAKLEPAAIEAAFQDAPLASLQAMAEVLAAALEHLQAIETVFANATGASGPDVSGVVRIVRQAQQALGPRLERRRADEGPAPSGDGAIRANGVAVASAASGEIRSREDVVHALDKICSYYERHEPSSPLPLLLQRCKRLATMSFIEVVREMVPGGLAQLEVIAGKLDEG
jgi:type VI secretion system protein ImpA